MASQLRLQVLAPIAVIAVLGLAVSAFVMSRNNPATSDADAIAARIAAKQHTQTPAKPKPKPAAHKPTPRPKPAKVATLAPLTRALKQKPVAVLLFYKPGSDYDAILARETRAGALGAGAAFVAVNVSKNSEVGKLASEYGVLGSPSVLVFRRGPVLKSRFVGYIDRVTVVQAVRNAR